jgi:hypothetical protein
MIQGRDTPVKDLSQGLKIQGIYNTTKNVQGDLVQVQFITASSNSFSSCIINNLEQGEECGAGVEQCHDGAQYLLCFLSAFSLPPN